MLPNQLVAVIHIAHLAAVIHVAYLVAEIHVAQLAAVIHVAQAHCWLRYMFATCCYMFPVGWLRYIHVAHLGLGHMLLTGWL